MVVADDQDSRCFHAKDYVNHKFQAREFIRVISEIRGSIFSSEALPPNSASVSLVLCLNEAILRPQSTRKKSRTNKLVSYCVQEV